MWNAYAIRFVLLGIALLAWGHVGFAQVTSGAISGTVKDETGGLMPGVSVSVKNVDTGAARTLVTDDRGRYHAANLSLGSYEVQAELSGFQTAARTGIRMTVGREAVVDFVLNVGGLSERVVVMADAPLIDTTTSAVSGLVEERAIRELPLNGRSFDELVLLQAGTLKARRAESPGSFLGGGAKVSIAGARPQQNSFLLDGTDVNDPRNTMPGGAAGVFLGVETVREFRVLTSAYSAEYGRSAGGVITAVTRSGTNELHGTLFEFHRNSAFDARNFFDGAEPPPFKRNQYGFTAGGPIVKGRTFFFGSYEGLRDRLGLTRRATVPNALTRQGILPVRGELVDFGVAASVRPYLDLFPLPNGADFGNGTGQFISAVNKRTDEDYFVVRLDHQLSSRHSLFGRYTLDNADQTTPWDIPIQTASAHSRSQYLTLENSTVLTSNAVNVLRFGSNRSYVIDRTELDVPTSLGWVPGIPFASGGFLRVSGLVDIGNQRSPQWWDYGLYELSDDVILTRGSHNIKTGLIFKRISLDFEPTNAQGGLYRFSGLQAFLQARPQQFLATVPGRSMLRNWQQMLFGAYVQDDFKPSSRLTANVGVRWEFMTGPREKNGRSSNLPDVMLQEPIVGNPFFETRKNSIAPRVGFAWDVSGTGRTVVSSGFGIFYDQPFPTYWMHAANLSPPFTIIAELNNPPFPNGFDAIDKERPTLGDLRPWNYTATPFAMQYNVTLRRQVGSDMAVSIGYVGSQGRNIVRTGQMNTKVPVLVDGVQFFPPNAPRRNPLWGNFRLQQTDASSSYDALLVNINKRFTRSFQFQSSYTLSKTMSMADAVFGADFQSGGDHQVMDPYNPELDRSLAGYDARHNFAASFSYEIPVAPGALGAVFQGWQVNGIMTLSSGNPFSPLSDLGSDNGSFGSAIHERPNLVAGQSSNPVLGGPERYFDVSAFALPQRGFYGNLGRNTIIGPGLASLDVSVFKNIAAGGSRRFQLRAEIFNVLNRANFSIPARKLFDGQGNRLGDAGRINTTSTSARQIQFGLKLVF